MAKRYNLILTLPEGDPVCHQLTSAKVSFGRGEDNRIRVGVKAISSRHCEFRAVGDGYEVIDLGSTNGTKVNGTRVNGLPVRLKNGDQILFGETVGGHFFAAVDAAAGPESVAARGLASRSDVPDDEDALEDWLPINPVAAAVAQQEGSFHLLRQGVE